MRKADSELIQAVRCGDYKGCGQALEDGADVNAAEPEQFDTPLHIACRCNNTEADAAIFDLLLAHGADPNRENVFGETPMHIAAKEAPQLLKALDSDGGSWDSKDRNQNTPRDIFKIKYGTNDKAKLYFKDMVRKHHGDDLKEARAAFDILWLELEKEHTIELYFKDAPSVSDEFLKIAIGELNGWLSSSAIKNLTFPDADEEMLARIAAARASIGETYDEFVEKRAKFFRPTRFDEIEIGPVNGDEPFVEFIPNDIDEETLNRIAVTNVRPGVCIIAEELAQTYDNPCVYGRSRRVYCDIEDADAIKANKRFEYYTVLCSKNNYGEKQ